MPELARARFGREGYAGTTIDDVAADTGVTKPLLSDESRRVRSG